MDDVFNSGIPAWRSGKKKSRLDELQTEIERGEVKVVANDSADVVEDEKKV